jgi:CheY-like chemotaxis protein
VQDGIQAVAQVQQGDADDSLPDLILMDCRMPGMDGFEATEKIRALSGAAARIPIVGFTAHGDGETRARCLKIGMNDLVTKPARIADLVRVLDPFFEDFSEKEG